MEARQAKREENEPHEGAANEIGSEAELLPQLHQDVAEEVAGVEPGQQVSPLSDLVRVEASAPHSVSSRLHQIGVTSRQQPAEQRRMLDELRPHELLQRRLLESEHTSQALVRSGAPRCGRLWVVAATVTSHLAQLLHVLDVEHPLSPLGITGIQMEEVDQAVLGGRERLPHELHSGRRQVRERVSAALEGEDAVATPSEEELRGVQLQVAFSAEGIGHASGRSIQRVLVWLRLV